MENAILHILQIFTGGVHPPCRFHYQPLHPPEKVRAPTIGQQNVHDLWTF